jgi:molecular chaperone HtpG
MSKIKIGKNAIENLTIGMYEDSKIIYREYIQNAADQIDKALNAGMFPNEELSIEISIDPKKRIILIKDNATGILQDEIAKKLADVADSDKEKGIDKGFRGIGRLGGLAYCDTLRFITTYRGEKVKTIMTWNGKEFNRLIGDNSIKYSAEEVLTRIISYEQEPCKIEEHFFIVELNGIRKENNELLDVEGVRRYISSNVPVPYNNKFIFKSKIYDFLQDKNLPKNEYAIYVDDEIILKDYSTVLYDNSSGQKKKYDEIHDIQFKDFKNPQGELLAWMWFGISAFEKQIPATFNEMRGIRLRKDNIQVGNADTLVKLFREQRGNFYFIGEIHAVHKDLIPNARRDYFNENENRNEFEVELKYYFGDTLHKLYTEANKVKNAYKREINLRGIQYEYQKKMNEGFINNIEKENLQGALKVAEAENVKASKDIENIKKKSDENEALKKVINVIEQKHISSIDSSVEKNKSEKNNVEKPKEKIKYVVDGLNLSKEEKKLVSKIYSVIKAVLPAELSDSLIKKIQDELNDNGKKNIASRTKL